MIKRIFTVIGALLLLFASSMQAQDDYNPTLPGEPQAPQPPVVKYALTVTCQPAAAGKAAGGGSYAEGSTVTVSTSANAEYTFSHWMLNGERYEATTATSFSYTTIAGDMQFVAVYEYTPTPFEPRLPSNLNCLANPVRTTTNIPKGMWCRPTHRAIWTKTANSRLSMLWRYSTSSLAKHRQAANLPMPIATAPSTLLM